MKTKVRYIAMFIAMSMILSSFSMISTYAVDINIPNMTEQSEEELQKETNEFDSNIDFVTEESGCVSITAEEEEAVVITEEYAELQPLAASYCEDSGGTSSSGGNYAGYRYGYYPSAAHPYYLGHPDGRTRSIGDPTMFDLCDDYRSKIQEMIHADENAEALTRLIGIAVSVGMVFTGLGLDKILIKTYGESAFRNAIINYLSLEYGIDSQLREEIIDILMPAFVDIQNLMREADIIFENIDDLCG